MPTPTPHPNPKPIPIPIPIPILDQVLDEEPNSLAALNLDFLANKLSATLDAAAAGLPLLPGSATRLLAAQVVTYTELVTVWSANPKKLDSSPNPSPSPNHNPNPNTMQVSTCAPSTSVWIRWRALSPGH